MSKKTKNNLFAGSILVTLLGALVLTGAATGRVSSTNTETVSTGITGDVLSETVTAASLREFFAAQERVRGFHEVGVPLALAPVNGPARNFARVAVPYVLEIAAASDEWQSGSLIGRIDADSSFAPLGLSAGRNYLWVDNLGSSGHPLRAVLISADGASRQLMVGFRYASDSDHNAEKPSDHALQYCNGANGCFLLGTKEEPCPSYCKLWIRCPQGCCQVNFRPEPLLEITKPSVE